MSTGTGIQRRVDRARSFRFYATFAALVNVSLAAADLAEGSAAGALAPASLLVFFLVLVFVQTRVIRALERQQLQELARPRMTPEDWRHLREMEAGLGWELSEIPADVEASPLAALTAADILEAHERLMPPRAVTLPVAGGSSMAGFGRGMAHLHEQIIASQGIPPAQLARETTIATMKPGCTYWAVPWAMRADEEGRLWLGAGYTAWPDRGGTAEMRVELREDGVHAWVVKGEAYARVTGGGPEGVPVAVLEGMAGEASLGDAAVRDRIAGMVAKAADAPSYALARSDREIAAARAAEHFAALARVGLEHCASYCPICLHRLFGPVPGGWPAAGMRQWLEENWGWRQ